MKAEQLEIRFENSRPPQPATRRQRRSNRAAWWFTQMRRTVDSACDGVASPMPATNRFPEPDLVGA